MSFALILLAACSWRYADTFSFEYLLTIDFTSIHSQGPESLSCRSLWKATRTCSGCLLRMTTARATQRRQLNPQWLRIRSVSLRLLHLWFGLSLVQTFGDWITFVLTPAVPGPPTLLEAQDITATSANLSWQAPVDNGGSPITNYLIEKKQPQSSRWSKVNK